MRIIKAAEQRMMPWKNGAGSTTEIAVWPEGAGLHDFAWRVSTALVASDGPFSLFEGVDRTLTVLEGGPLGLTFSDGRLVSLDTASAPFAFAGDVAVQGAVGSHPVRDLNVLTRRGVWRQSVWIEWSAFQMAGGVRLAVVRGGAAEARCGSDTHMLDSGDAVMCAEDDAVLEITVGDGATAYAIVLEEQAEIAPRDTPASTVKSVAAERYRGPARFR
jgi:uncharacterized protein